jgi:3-hydroxyisobutyrate dehydrogenase-like beta-hydroxyacid dehydrogenase
MNIGFIGLGIMGRPMVLNLLKGGHRVRVWARRPESMQALLDAGASAAGKVGDVVSVQVIPRPHDELSSVIPKPKGSAASSSPA